MRRSRLMLLPAVLIAAAAAPAVLRAYASSSGSTISVIEGKPRELQFKVSPSFITTPIVTVEVTNKGKLPHAFKFCTNSSPDPNANSCSGATTKLLAPGASTTLTVTFPASGNYEYLSGAAWQAAAGMKGFVIVRLGDTAPGSGASIGSSPGTTSPGSGRSSVVWGPDGAASDPACPPGVYIGFTGSETPANPSDQDEDNEGGFPTDNDGCV